MKQICSEISPRNIILIPQCWVYLLKLPPVGLVLPVPLHRVLRVPPHLERLHSSPLLAKPLVKLPALSVRPLLSVLVVALEYSALPSQWVAQFSDQVGEPLRLDLLVSVRLPSLLRRLDLGVLEEEHSLLQHLLLPSVLQLLLELRVDKNIVQMS